MGFKPKTILFVAALMCSASCIHNQPVLYYAYTATYNRPQENSLSPVMFKCSHGEGGAHDCGYGTLNQNWFGPYFIAKDNPYGFLSTMPYGYGSGAQPLYSDPQSGGLPGTSYGPGGYFTSAGPINPFFPQPIFPVI